MENENGKIETASAVDLGSRYVPIVGRRSDGSTVWYTGRSGQAFVSENACDAFLGYSLEGARAKATRLNVMTPLHGIWFVACVGDLASSVTAKV
jgi:hypothetical protein